MAPSRHQKQTDMKNLNHILRSMKRIAPDQQYAASSRAEILASRRIALPRLTLATFFRTAGVTAMAGLAFVGGLSLVRMTLPQSPSQPVSQQALAAEAQAIDSQLALADVQNQAVSGSSGRSVSPAAASIAKSAAGTSADTSVDRALDALSE
jgi:hypothetical protein